MHFPSTDKYELTKGININKIYQKCVDIINSESGEPITTRYLHYRWTTELIFWIRLLTVYTNKKTLI